MSWKTRAPRSAVLRPASRRAKAGSPRAFRQRFSMRRSAVVSVPARLETDRERQSVPFGFNFQGAGRAIICYRVAWDLEMNYQLIQRIWRRCKVGQLFNYSPCNARYDRRRHDRCPEHECAYARGIIQCAHKKA
jgi:hypothetical protein